MSGGGGSSSTTNNIPGELAPLARAYADKALQIGNNPFQAYSGQRFAELSQGQNQAGNFYQQQMGSGTNPYLDAMVGRAQGNLVDNYNNVIRPQQDALMARSGSFGNSGVDSTVNQQQKQLLGQLGDISTQMYGGQYNADQNRRFEAAQGLMGYGGLQQMAAQNPLDFQYQQFQDAQNQPYKNLAAMGAPFGANMGSSSTTSQSKGAMGNLQSLLGLGLLGGVLFSDKRLKTDIKKVGETDDGVNVYTYKYKGDDTTQMGVLAQEVKKKNPGAVKKIEGLLAVDYSKVS